MNDAKLHNPENHGIQVVNGLEVRVHSWHVNLNGSLVGTVYAPFCGDSFGAFVGDNNKDFPTRNEAVAWILAQHKEAQS
mgnify:CR=1 FL=1